MKCRNNDILLSALAATTLACASWAHGGERVSFTPSWDASWQHEAGAEMCAVSLDLAEYGVARFVASPAEAPAFELQARQDMHLPGPIRVSTFAPPWHPAPGTMDELGNLTHIEGGGAVARGSLAADMLMALRRGLHVALSAPTWFDAHTEVRLDLTARGLTPALDEFTQCAHTNVKIAWQEMSRTRLTYEVDEHALSEAHRGQLEALARYVLQDPTVIRLFVDGHTDSSGTRRQNYGLAKRRAETVAAYLAGCGVDKQRMVVRYHGAAYPVADNSTPAGQARNRRTTVRLERGQPADLARN